MEEGLIRIGWKQVPEIRLNTYPRQVKNHSFFHWDKVEGGRKGYFTDFSRQGQGRKLQTSILSKKFRAGFLLRRKGLLMFGSLKDVEKVENVFLENLREKQNILVGP